MLSSSIYYIMRSRCTINVNIENDFWIFKTIGSMCKSVVRFEVFGNIDRFSRGFRWMAWDRSPWIGKSAVSRSVTVCRWNRSWLVIPRNTQRWLRDIIAFVTMELLELFMLHLLASTWHHSLIATSIRLINPKWLNPLGG